MVDQCLCGLVCSGFETDVLDCIKQKNKTGVDIEIRNILAEKEGLVFKRQPEAEIKIRKQKNNIVLEINDFYSPILMRKLETENNKTLQEEYKARVTDFRQIIESVAIDIDYNGKLFNAEIIDIASKKRFNKNRI